jgi:hypothetical protein
MMCYTPSGLRRGFRPRAALTTRTLGVLMAKFTHPIKFRDWKLNFWDRVEIKAPNECWPWTGPLSHKGYGRYCVNRVRKGAHAYALIAAGIEQPPAPSNNALHSCDNPPCCNPAHLRWGTSDDNTKDRNERNPGYSRNPRKGVRHHWTVLDEEKVRNIRESSSTNVELAKLYGVSRANIGDIRRFRSWKDVGGSER